MLLALSVLAVIAAAAGTRCPPAGSERYLIPHESDCSKFYNCAHGVPTLQSCPEGTHFSETFMNCQNPIFARCSTDMPESEFPCEWPTTNIFRPHPDTCNKYYVCEHGVAQVFDCPEGLKFDSRLKECVWPHESDCDKNDGGHNRCRNGALSAHKKCNMYYICIRGEQVARRCPAGLQWSSKAKRCVRPHQSDCRRHNEGDDSQDNAGSQDGACQDGALSAHKDCDKYNICNHGAQLAQDCPKGLQWSSIAEECVWPHESDCDKNDGGQNRCRNGALSAHKKCNMYYICIRGEQVARRCPAGLQWSSKAKRCVRPHQSDCRRHNEGDDSQDDAGSQSQDGACQDGALSAHKDCDKYNICNHGAQLAQDCPQGLQWSSIAEECVWPHESDCDKNDGGQNRCRNGALSAHKKCNMYYICIRGEQVARRCPAGLQWSSKAKRCVRPHQSDCRRHNEGDDSQDDAGSQDGACQDGALSAHKDCDKYNICNHGAELAQNCPHGLQWSSIVEQCVWPNESDCHLDGACQDGALSAHEDCSKYNICNFGALVAMDCPFGLHWNAQVQFCDLPLTAGCV